ncbi:hypothetical protein J6590_090504 [Homalodisca vitripennis]|nr:hypothetical protein J6590_087534 [Homalodisca vitripennis]KAG8329263.1 hypothetical protein J6590_090504 [Homalodisca vitripennis]
MQSILLYQGANSTVHTTAAALPESHLLKTVGTPPGHSPNDRGERLRQQSRAAPGALGKAPVIARQAILWIPAKRQLHTVVQGEIPPKGTTAMVVFLLKETMSRVSGDTNIDINDNMYGTLQYETVLSTLGLQRGIFCNTREEVRTDEIESLRNFRAFREAVQIWITTTHSELTT